MGEDERKELCDEFERLKEDLLVRFEILQGKSEKVIRWYLSFIFGIVLAMGGMFGWVAIDHIHTTNGLEQLNSDFGLSVRANYSEHPENLIYESLMQKYNATRGSNKETSETDK